MTIASSGSDDYEAYQHCLEVLRTHEGELLTHQDVIGVGVGRSNEGELGLVLLMRRLPPTEGESNMPLPVELSGIPVWPRLIGSIQAQPGETDRE